MNDRIIFEDVSKFYGEVLGVNRISLSIPPGITTLVGPNGSGKTTIMNLMTGLVQPSNGRISVLGLSPADQTELFSILGYCTQFDFFPRGLTGWQFVLDGLMLHGMEEEMAVDLAVQAIERVQLGDAAGRKIAGYSKGMRQKIRLAQAIAHHPRVLVLDEPLNGLDPMARAESIALFEELGRQGMHVLISSHILDEVDRISDRVILITGGYLIAEGNIHQVRQEVHEKPMQVLIRCDHPEVLAAKMFAINHCVEARLHADGKGVFLRTADIDQFYSMLNGIAADGLVKIDAVAPADDDANAIYQYLIGNGWEPIVTQMRLAGRARKLAQQPWGLWWLQAQRLTRIELRRNLFSWKATWIYCLAFIPTVIIADSHAVRPASVLRDERGHQHIGRHRPALLHPARGFLRVPWDFFAADSRRDD